MLTQKAIDLIKASEGCKLSAYVDPATGGEPITIGYGNTKYEDGSKVKLGDKITQDRANSLLLLIVEGFKNSVLKLLTKELNANQLGALTSFAYNCGIANLKSSTLLKKVNANPNDPSIKDEFAKWNKANKKVMNGLTIRRKKESDLYYS